MPPIWFSPGTSAAVKIATTPLIAAAVNFLIGLVRELNNRVRRGDILYQLEELGPDSATANPQLFHADGCPACDNTGYRGRLTILELLTMNDALRRAIIDHADADTLRVVALSHGMSTMRTDGLRKALAGLTTVEEVERVAQTSLQTN